MMMNTATTYPFRPTSKVEAAPATQKVVIVNGSTEILELLNKVGNTVAAEIDLEKAVQTVTDIATQLSGAAFGASLPAERPGEWKRRRAGQVVEGLIGAELCCHSTPTCSSR